MHSRSCRDRWRPLCLPDPGHQGSLGSGLGTPALESQTLWGSTGTPRPRTLVCCGKGEILAPRWFRWGVGGDSPCGSLQPGGTCLVVCVFSAQGLLPLPSGLVPRHSGKTRDRRPSAGHPRLRPRRTAPEARGMETARCQPWAAAGKRGNSWASPQLGRSSSEHESLSYELKFRVLFKGKEKLDSVVWIHF